MYSSCDIDGNQNPAPTEMQWLPNQFQKESMLWSAGRLSHYCELFCGFLGLNIKTLLGILHWPYGPGNLKSNLKEVQLNPPQCS